MIFLPELTEPSIVHNIRERYAEHIIYTYVGPVLISLNPYCDMVRKNKADRIFFGVFLARLMLSSRVNCTHFIFTFIIEKN